MFSFFNGGKGTNLSVTENEHGKPSVVELRDDEGNLVERETYSYDENGDITQRNTFDGSETLVEYEVWTRDAEGRLAQHELHRADGTPVYIEKWTRDADGKLVHGEAWRYDESGAEVGYKKYLPNSEGHLVDPARKRAVTSLRAFCLVVGGWCLVTAMQSFQTGQVGMGVFAGLLALLNFWNGIRKR